MSQTLSDTYQKYKAKFDSQVKFDEPLAPYLAYQIGGPADILIFVSDSTDLEWIKTQNQKDKLPVHILGTGTNLLVSDLGLRGISILLGNSFKAIEPLSEDREQISLLVGAGIDKQDLLNWSIDRGYSGLEFSSGVPGTLGGGIFMNAGTKYGCYGDVTKAVTLFSFSQGLQTLSTNSHDFHYRSQSILQDPDTVVLSVQLRLKKELDPLALQEQVSSIIAEREFKQPLNYPSCGSTFKNPPGYSAGRLIEKAGLKGTQAGGAIISEKHANFILNINNAKAQDIIQLIELVKKVIKEKFDVRLECEVILLGQHSFCTE